MAVCPKCGYKLKLTDIKPECPKCGINLMYYDMENRLEQDAKNAEAEYENQAKFRRGIKSTTIGGKWAIIRLVVYLLLTAILFLPIFYTNIQISDINGSKASSLLTVISGLMSGNMTSGGSLFVSVYFIGSLVLNLTSLVVAVFAFKPNGLKKNIITTCVLAVFQIAMAIIIASATTYRLNFGLFAVVGLIAVLVVTHKLVFNEIKKGE
ncbi:MAG: hypothetical protein RR327_02325 [Clostridia bacterium]